MNKIQASRQHAAKRLVQRAHTMLSPEMDVSIREGIKGRQFVLIEEQQRKRQVWEVPVGHRLMHVVYDVRDDVLVTFMDARERIRDKVPMTYQELLDAREGWTEC